MARPCIFVLTQGNLDYTQQENSLSCCQSGFYYQDQYGKCIVYVAASIVIKELDRDKRIWYLSPMRAVKVQASLRIRAVSPEPSLLAHTSSESRGTFRQKARSLAPRNG